MVWDNPPNNFWGHACVCANYAPHTVNPVYEMRDPVRCPGHLQGGAFRHRCSKCEREYSSLEHKPAERCPGEVCRRCKGWV